MARGGKGFFMDDPAGAPADRIVDKAVSVGIQAGDGDEEAVFFTGS